MTADERLRRKNEFDASLVIGARRFNLATGRERHLSQRGMLKNTFLDPSTGALKPGLGVERACPLCGAAATREIFVKDGFRHGRCVECSMVYVNPVLSQERLHAFYEEETSYNAVLTSAPQRDLDEKRFVYALDVLEQYIAPGRLVDVGCGPGTFLRVAQARGWGVSGVEFNAHCVRLLQDAGVDVIDAPLERARLVAGSFQCVALWDVLEHITAPLDFLATLRPLLSERGVLMIEVPQLDSLVSRVLHEKSATFAGDSHINFFNMATLTRLLENAGFAVIDAETLITELGAITNHLGFEDPYFGDAPPLLDCLTPQYIHEHMLGARLFVLAQTA